MRQWDSGAVAVRQWGTESVRQWSSGMVGRLDHETAGHCRRDRGAVRQQSTVMGLTNGHWDLTCDLLRT
jgi:hypothetical protein